MPLPPAGWVSSTNGAAMTRFPLPAPLICRYRDGVGPIVRGAAVVQISEHATAGSSAAAHVGFNANDVRVLELELRIDTAYAVLLVDRIVVPAAGWTADDPPASSWTNA